jgi:tetratricopeptide (TPR) repeat protein
MAQTGVLNPSPAAPAGLRGCSTCGAGNPATARFCAQCGAGLPSLAGGPPGSAAALLDAARQHILLGHWEDAALAAEAMLALDPDSAEAHNIAARARLKQGMPAGALRHAERAVELDGDSAEYQATLAEAMRGGDAASSALSNPTLLASAAALAVIALIMVLAFTGKPKPSPSTTRPAAIPTGAASPFAQTPGSAVYPRPSRPSGVNYDAPRVPARAAAPGPSALATPNPARQRQTAGDALASNAPAGLPPAPVDASALQRFAPPAPVAVPAPAPAPQAAAPQHSIPPIIPPLGQARRGQVTAPPPAQPGTSIFGTSPSAARPDTNASAPPAPAATPAPRPTAEASPQQQYVERDYGAAIQGYQNQIQNGNATGAKYQQLGLSYERVGDRQKAAAAYQNAIAAYRAQVQAGQDTEIATRGLRSTQRALNMLGNK